MWCIKIIFLVFAIWGTCVSSESRSCSIPKNETHITYSIDSNNNLIVKCEENYYYLGHENVKCENQKWIGQKSICFSSGCPVLNKTTKNGKIIPTDLISILYCDRGYSFAGNKESYCNGTQWDRPLGECRGNTTETKCDFEREDLCRWSSESVQSHEWSREIAIDVFGSFSAGPPHDHTTISANSGYYMVMHSSNLSKIEVPLLSPVYNSTISSKIACFDFYYFMSGVGVGNLSVYIKPKSVLWENLSKTPE